MKKLILSLLLATTLFSTTASAEEWHSRQGWHHDGGGRFGWGLLGGIVLGGIIAHEMDGHYYDDYHREVVRVSECHPQQIVDSWGHLVYDQYGRPIMQEVCVERWQRVDNTTVIIEQPPQ